MIACGVVKPKDSRWFRPMPFVEVFGGLANYVLRVGFYVAIVVCKLVELEKGFNPVQESFRVAKVSALGPC